MRFSEDGRLITWARNNMPPSPLRCPQCGLLFVQSNLRYTPKFCSKSCCSTAQTGIKKGPCSEERKRKISAANFGRTITPETRLKMSEAKIGCAPWNKGKRMWDTRPHPRGTLGKKMPKKVITKETIDKMSRAHLGIPQPHKRKENHWNWNGGITSENKCARVSIQYKNWRRSVFARDNFTCVKCGIRGGYLNADHIKPFALFPELRFDINNGMTLCVDCHKKTETYGGRIKKYAARLVNSETQGA